MGALTRSRAQIIQAHSETEARSLIRTNPEGLPELVILHLNYEDQEDPLNFVKELRDTPTTRAIPIIILTDTPIERAMVQGLHLPRCCCIMAPLSYGSLIFALPSLEIQISDSMLYRRLPTAEDPGSAARLEHSAGNVVNRTSAE